MKHRLASLLAAVFLAAACASPTASGPVPSPTAPPASPIGSPSAEGFSLRAWVRQAIPPAIAYRDLLPPVAIEDGVAIFEGSLDTTFPMGLPTILEEHPISDAGVERLIEAANAAGLLSGPTDYAPDAAPGARTAEIVFVIDGVERRITGDPNLEIVCVTTPCDAAPGTPEAFGGFWSKLENLQAFLGDELGEAAVRVPDRLAILLVEPMLDATIPPQYADWPVSGVSMRDFGVELSAPNLPPSRCGVVEGAGVSAVIAALRAGNEYTRWRDGSGDEYGIVSRPLFPDEANPCGAA
jgi:hypothetical protein